MTQYLVTPYADGELREEVMSVFVHPDSGDVHVVYLVADRPGCVRAIAQLNFTAARELGETQSVVEEQVVDVLG